MWTGVEGRPSAAAAARSSRSAASAAAGARYSLAAAGGPQLYEDIDTVVSAREELGARVERRRKYPCAFPIDADTPAQYIEAAEREMLEHREPGHDRFVFRIFGDRGRTEAQRLAGIDAAVGDAVRFWPTARRSATDRSDGSGSSSATPARAAYAPPRSDPSAPRSC